MSSITLTLLLPNSSEALGEIYSPLKNPIACANYGGGVHCNKNKIDIKLDRWGNDNLKKNETNCLGAKIIEDDGKPVALFNIGTPGTPPTVKDHIRGG